MKQQREPDDAAVEELVARALVDRGELAPTTVGEVRAAEEQGVEFEGELPEALRQPPFAEPGAPRSRAADVLPAASERVVDLDAVRRARTPPRSSSWSHLATFMGGVAAAAAVALALRSTDPHHPVAEPRGGPGPAPSTSAAALEAPIAVPAVRACGAGCCAGASCGDAKGELRSCLSGRACVGCETPDAAAAYEVLLANVAPAPALGGVPRETLDHCGRGAGAQWSCSPAYVEPAVSPAPRTLGRLASTADLSSGLEIELRPRGAGTAIGGWKDSVRLGATVLCRGLGVLLTNAKGEKLGSLAIALGDPYYVELGRSADVAALRGQRARLAFEDVTPFVIESEARDDRRYLLAAGPFDRATAERLRWALVERKVDASTVFGRDFVGTPLPLPMR
ncbi:MAG: hypothetical protein WKG00_12305 [Polyangiaceae bacterium]